LYFPVCFAEPRRVGPKPFFRKQNPEEANPGKAARRLPLPPGVSSQARLLKLAPRKAFLAGIPQQILAQGFCETVSGDQEFLASPSPARAEQHLKILTARLTSPDRRKTKLRGPRAKHFDIAGMETEEVKYSYG